MNHTEGRYDKLKGLISREFSRARTLTPAVEAGAQDTLISLSDFDSSFALPDQFEKFGPFNALYVRNFGDYDVRLFLNEDRSVYVDIPASSNQAVPVIEKVPIRYISYLRIENLNNNNAISEGDIQIQVGNEVDSEELTLLEMAGELNV
jgi:hypothetical protein